MEQIATARMILNPLYTTDETLTPIGDLDVLPSSDGHANRPGDIVVLQPEMATLGPVDFQRIGVQPKETRVDVIRRAASRAAKSLARRQLRAPSPMTEQKLSRIAVSTYRVLDPRQRDDRQSQAHVGRIRPGALMHSGRVSFADGDNLFRSKGIANSTTVTTATSMSSTPDAPASESSIPPTVAQEIDLDAIFPVFNVKTRRSTRERRKTGRPAVVVTIIMALIVTLLITAAASEFWDWTL